jgi:hypothetical protein
VSTDREPCDVGDCWLCTRLGTPCAAVEKADRLQLAVTVRDRIIAEQNVTIARQEAEADRARAELSVKDATMRSMQHTIRLLQAECDRLEEVAQRAPVGVKV